jgi:hypothetical protein
MIDAIEQIPVTLPSRGRLYKDDRIPDGKVTISPWTVAQEEVLLSFGESDYNTLVTQLLENNVHLPNSMPCGDLLLTDQFFLMVQLRCHSYVPWHTMVHTCPHCKHEHAVQIDLGTLEVKVPDDDVPYVEPIDCFLPKRKKTVQLKYLRFGDEVAAGQYSAKSKTSMRHTTRQYLYARQIVSIDDKSLPWDEKMEFVLTLPLLDLECIKMRLNERTTGITGRVPTKCPACGKEDDTWAPPLHVNFFRPTKADLDRGCVVV